MEISSTLTGHIQVNGIVWFTRVHEGSSPRSGCLERPRSRRSAAGEEDRRLSRYGGYKTAGQSRAGGHARVKVRRFGSWGHVRLQETGLRSLRPVRSAGGVSLTSRIEMSLGKV